MKLKNNLIIQVENNVGRCRPVYDAFYHASDSVCMAILEPLVSTFCYIYGLK